MQPTLYLLQAAALAATVLAEPRTTQTVADASYRSLVSGGFYRIDALRSGQAILEDAELLIRDGDDLHLTDGLLRIREMPEPTAVELIMHALVLVEQPLWLFGILDDAGLHWENVPDDEQRVLSAMHPTAAQREAFLLGLARTFDAHRLTELGAAGEDFVVAACRHHLTGQGREDLSRLVNRVSLVSDQLGYDVTAVDTAGSRHRLEVKATRAAVDRFQFFLSRNEADVAARDPDWALVAVVLDGTDDRILGWCRGATLTPALPVDTSSYGQWASVRVTLPLSELTPGLPLVS